MAVRPQGCQAALNRHHMGESPAEKASFLPLQKLALNSHIPENLSRCSCVFHVMPCVCVLFPQIEERSFYGTECNLYFSVLPSSPPTSNTFISLCPPGLNCASFPPPHTHHVVSGTSGSALVTCHSLGLEVCPQLWSIPSHPSELSLEISSPCLSPGLGTTPLLYPPELKPLLCSCRLGTCPPPRFENWQVGTLMFVSPMPGRQ